MGIAGAIIVWLFLTIFFIAEIISVTINGTSFPFESLWFFIVLWFVSLIIIIVFYYYRKSSQEQFKKALKEQELGHYKFDQGEYFYQAPIVTLDNQLIPIYGQTNMKYQTAFNNIIEKWLSILDVFPLFGVELTSEHHEVHIRRIQIWNLRPHYKVTLDGTNIGTLKRKKIISEKGITQQLPYILTTKDNHYDFTNNYLSMETSIEDASHNTFFKAHRSLIDVFKNRNTKKRGENHDITIEESDFPDELWIALYIQLTINRKTSS
ncbi:hypothetical protein [Staphylococcus massiliensis]|uniref:Uncharacterized protein n=1 Tax=Staphylococcus massiliensis S46 TaxID=1229783 RepID=K9AL83_9STAP|nr:hypothetical protein [Staphylococcus massiliensis]EKU48133.1 hypothetical protein C273_05487 [Staphylococcus massiliensis S46]MCG3399604.1 hypothetical protein [Staphylococcus massiliensis]MCG3402115.1 hypothetical protein [Staphylococcus massiliensis]MCG3413315.1 hypothetical protein [Staphylococcus massiliensis]PNZ98999.1 hypothetical protein CD133_07315 [Staphylococcus massiliensis CCUG 55927]